MVNVLQSMILTRGPQMLLTPTYHVFEMYTVHHDAMLLPIITIETRAITRSVPILSRR